MNARSKAISSSSPAPAARAGWPRAVIDALDHGFAQCMPVLVLWGPHRRLYFNDSAQALLYYAPQRPREGDPMRAGWPSLFNKIHEPCDRVWNGGPAEHQHFVGVLDDATAAGQRYFSFVFTAMHDESNHVIGVHCTVVRMPAQAHDIEQARHAEADANNPTALPLPRIINKLPQLMWTARHDGAIEYANETWLNYTGMSLQETLGAGWTKALHPDDVARTASAWGDALSRAVPIDVEYRLRRYDGSYRWHLAKGSPYPAPQGGPPYWVGTLTDIDEQKRAFERLAQAEELMRGQMEQLRIAEARLRLATTGSQVGVWEMDMASGNIWRSGAHDALFGYDHPVKNWTLETTVQHMHPDDRELLKNTIREGVRTHAAFEVEFRVVWADGSLHWIAVQGEGHPNVGEGKMLGVVRDVTESHAAEDALRRAIAVREEFLSIASHELKTPVTSLKLQLQMAERQMKPGAEDVSSVAKLRRHITLSVYQVERLTRLIGDLLDVAKIQAGQVDYHFEDYDVGEMIQDVLDRLSEQLESVACSVKVHMDHPVCVRWDRSRMEQVLVNLLSNAVKYAPGKPISITANRAGEHVIIAVRDEGPGIPVEGQERIFKRFERAVSSRNISGLGLGLFIVKEIVTQHGGIVHVESRPGHGARFVVDLPQRVNPGMTRVS